MSEKKQRNYTCKSCRAFQVCSDKNKLPEKLKPCALYQLKGNRQKKNKTMTDILADIKTLGKNDIIDKCADTDCRHYRSSGCTDNCARGAYGHPDCPYEFLTEDEKKSHPEHRAAANTFHLPKDPHKYCKTIPESLSKGNAEFESGGVSIEAKEESIMTLPTPEIDKIIKGKRGRQNKQELETRMSLEEAIEELFAFVVKHGCEIIIRPAQK